MTQEQITYLLIGISAVILIVLLVLLLLPSKKEKADKPKEAELVLEPKEEVKEPVKPVSEPQPKEEVAEEKDEVTKSAEPVVAAQQPKEEVVVEKEEVKKPVKKTTKPSTSKSTKTPVKTVSKAASAKPAQAEKEETVEKKEARYHVSQNKDDKSEFFKMWRVRLEGSTKTIKYFETQKEAIDFAEERADAKGTSVVIHKVDGTIRKQDYSKK